jgi:HEAT repeat protein
MPKSLPELREQLSAIEPDEKTYEGIGASEVESLRRLLDDEQDWLAARAVHALSRIDSSDARRSLLSAAQSPRLAVRAAAAASAQALPAEASDKLLSTLLGDPEPAVRKFAVKATSRRNSQAVQRRVRDLATSDQSAGLRRVAQRQTESFSAP